MVSCLALSFPFEALVEYSGNSLIPDTVRLKSSEIKTHKTGPDFYQTRVRNEPLCAEDFRTFCQGKGDRGEGQLRGARQWRRRTRRCRFRLLDADGFFHAPDA